MENKFLIDDVVEWCGVRGVVITSEYCSNYPIGCNFKGSVCPLAFTSDGRYYDWQEPSLKLIERPKKKVKRYKVLFQHGVDFIVSSGRYKSEEDFRMSNINKLYFKVIQLIKESEIEEDG